MSTKPPRVVPARIAPQPLELRSAVPAPHGAEDEWVSMREFADLEGLDLEYLLLFFLSVEWEEKGYEVHGRGVVYSRVALTRELKKAQAKDAARALGEP